MARSAHPLWKWLTERGARHPGQQGGEVELHQVPGRPRRQGDQALCAHRHTGVAEEGHRSGPRRQSLRSAACSQHVEPYAGDPILALVEVFNADPRPNKVNLSIGIYFDEQGRIPVMRSVQLAEARVVAQGGPKPYLPIEGAANFRQAVQQLLFGADHEVLASKRVATIQSVGSSGGLKVGADFIKRWFPKSEVWVSDPTWDNHRSMFEGAGIAVHSYPYYDGADGGVRFAEMLDTLDKLPARQRRAAARLLPQPHRRGPDARAMG